jgi:hypothetical protein
VLFEAEHELLETQWSELEESRSERYMLNRGNREICLDETVPEQIHTRIRKVILTSLKSTQVKRRSTDRQRFNARAQALSI